MRLPSTALLWALGLHLLFVLAIVLLVGPHGWDDGAITLAFSRTFAETGRIALTPASETVEGFSTVSWFLLNAAMALLKPGFDGAIAASQLLAGLFHGVSILLLATIARAVALRPATTAALLLTFALLGAPLSEVANSMEMTLLTATGLGLCVSLYFHRSLPLAALCAAIFLLTRFEAMIYFAAIVAPLLLQARYREFFLWAAFGLCLVGLQEIVRFALLHDIVPNTIHAKTNPPYSVSGRSALASRLRALAEPFLLLAPFFVLAAGRALRAWRLRGLTAGLPPTDVLILASPAAAVLGFALLVGTIGGYPGRVQFLSLPFLLLLAGLAIDRFGKELPVPPLAVATATTLAISWYLCLGAASGEALATLRGRDPAVGRVTNVTPDAYRATGLAVERIRVALGRDTITFLTPDIGGAALCCPRIRLVDLGLLTNRRLAREGYGALGSVIREEKPEIVEAHQFWASLPRLYDLTEFVEGYRPALVDRTRLFLRNDVFDALAPKGRLCDLRQPDCARKARQHRYVDHVWPTDDAAFLRHGSFLEL